jgi:hypothetical protein
VGAGLAGESVGAASLECEVGSPLVLAASCLAAARAISSGEGGSCCATSEVGFTIEGASRSFTYSCPSVGRGTGNA